MSKILNKNFQKVLTTESDFRNPQRQKRKNETWEMKINR